MRCVYCKQYFCTCNTLKSHWNCTHGRPQCDGTLRSIQSRSTLTVWPKTSVAHIKAATFKANVLIRLNTCPNTSPCATSARNSSSNTFVAPVVSIWTQPNASPIGSTLYSFPVWHTVQSSYTPSLDTSLSLPPHTLIGPLPPFTPTLLVPQLPAPPCQLIPPVHPPSSPYPTKPLNY